VSVHVGFGGLHVGGSVLDIRIARLIVSSVEEHRSIRRASAALGVPRSTLGARYRRALALLASLEQLDAPG
jgi:hypothetical protein